MGSTGKYKIHSEPTLMINARLLLVTMAKWCFVSNQLSSPMKILPYDGGFIMPIYSYDSEDLRNLCNKKAQLSLTNPRDAKACQICSNSTCLQRCRWQYWPIFIRLVVVASEICEIPRNSLKIQTYRVQGHPRSSILVSMESPYVTSY